MPDYLQELSRKYGKLLAQRTTQWGDSTRQYGVPGQTNVRAGNRTEADFTPLLDRLNNSAIGASAGLLAGGPMGALAGMVLPQLYGIDRELDRAMDAFGPGAGAMAMMPPMGKSLTRNVRWEPNPRIARLQGRLKKLDNIYFGPMGDKYTRGSPEREAWLSRGDALISRIQNKIDKLPPVAVPDTVSPAPTFFSSLHSAFKDPKLPEKLTAEQARAVLSKYPGVKQEEVKWLGVDELLKTKPKWTKSELLKHIEDNQIDVQEVTLKDKSNTETPDWDSLFEDTDTANPRYEQYTLPGGENYREVLLTWGNKPKEPELIDWRTGEELSNKDFQSGHFDTRNVLAHIRLKDRTTPDGKKVLFVEEVQSDWQKALHRQDQAHADPTTTWNYRAGQILREKGLDVYAPPIDVPMKGDILDVMRAVKNQVPDAPLVRNYHELTMKRIIRMAAEGGYDAVGWTTGTQQADRYSKALLDSIDNVEYNIGNKSLKAYKNGQLVRGFDNIDVEKLPAYVGSEAAENLLRAIPKSERLTYQQYNNQRRDELWREYQKSGGASLPNDWKTKAEWDQSWDNISNQRSVRREYYDYAAYRQEEPVALPVSSLTVGDRGYSSVYDQQLVQTADKIAKKFGGKVQKGKVRTGDELEDAGLLTSNVPVYADTHYLPIPTSMRQTLPTKPFPLFETVGPGLGSSFLVDYMRREAEKKDKGPKVQ
jgi:hypothetical protein